MSAFCSRSRHNWRVGDCIGSTHSIMGRYEILFMCVGNDCSSGLHLRLLSRPQAPHLKWEKGMMNMLASGRRLDGTGRTVQQDLSMDLGS